MADEITLNISQSLVNGELVETFAPGAVRIDQGTALAHDTVVIVGTSEEDMPVGDVSTLGRLCLLNLDASNYVQFGPKTAGVMAVLGRLKPGEPNSIRLEPGVTLRWIANTAPVNVKMQLLSN